MPPSSSHPSPQKGQLASRWLQGSEALALLSTTQAHLLSVQRVLDQIGSSLPIKTQLIAQRVDQEHLVLAVASAAQAAKLKQLAPSIAKGVNKGLATTGLKISRISFRPQPALLSLQKPIPRPSPIPAVDLARLMVISDACEHKNLQIALKRLIANQSK